MGENEELTAIDYLIKPIVELQKHPDFSLQALRIVSAISKMTTKELEQIQLDIIIERETHE
jgi:hypothetical protein